MISIRILKMLLAVGIVSVVAGCKVAVLIVEGGSVETHDFVSDSCHEGTICIHEIYTAYDGQYFIAQPKPGWRFVKWQEGEDFLCGGLTSASCDLTASPGNTLIDAFIADSKTYYLMPLFAPLTKIGAAVTMNGKAWAPMDSFGDLSWDEINAVCPVSNGGHCLVDGKLMEYDMTGWTWASVDDVNDLMNSEAAIAAVPIIRPILGPGPDGDSSPSAGLFLRQAGFPTTTFSQGCSGCMYYTWKGWTSTAAGEAGQAHLGETYLGLDNPQTFSVSGHRTTLLTDTRSAGHSAWFYRTP